MWDCYDELRMMSVFRETERPENMSTVFEKLAEKRANERAEETRIKTLFDSIKILWKSWDGQQSRQWKQ